MSKKSVGIMSVLVWNISSKLSPDISKWTIAEMGRAWQSFPHTVTGDVEIEQLITE